MDTAKESLFLLVVPIVAEIIGKVNRILIRTSICPIDMECIVLERYLHMVSSCNLSVKFSEELDFFDTSLQVVIIQKPFDDMQQVVILDLRVGYQEFIDLLYRHILH